MSHTLYIVSGMHRSGTSAAARLLEVFGISLPGELVGPAADNEKGFFEDKSIIELNTEILEKLGLRWDSLNGFFLERTDFSSPKFNHLKRRARHLLETRIAEDQDWAFKDPRVSRLLGFWMPIIEDLDIPCRFIISVRAPAEVAGSLAVRNNFPHLKSLYLWLLHNLDLLISSAGYPRTLVRYERLVNSPEETISSLENFLPPALEEEKLDFLNTFLSTELRHNQGVELHAQLELADELFDLLQSGDLQQELLTALKQRLQSMPELQDVFKLLSDQEAAREAELEAQHAGLSSVIERKDEDLVEYRAYQKNLEADLKHQKDWTDKLTNDVSKSQKDTRLLQEVKLKLDGDVARLSAEVERANAEIGLAKVEIERQLLQIQKVESELATQKLTAEKETMRLWAIIEKYRVELETMVLSHSWKITAPMRWLRRVIHQAPRKVTAAIGQALHRAVFSLPPDSMLRQRLLRTYERGQILLHGDVDNQSIRESHQSIIASRDQLLGEKQLLADDKLPDIDISVVVYNSERWIDSFMESLESQDYPLSKIHLVFVDNGSTDRTVEFLSNVNGSAYASFKCLKNKNVGFGEGHNRGIAEGAQPLLLVTNVDLQFHQDSLRRAVSFASQDEAGVASWELRQLPFEHPKFYDPVSLQTAWSSHACILMRREVFETAGGYERRIFMYGEDVELSYRFRSLGYKLRYLPAACVDHFTYEEAGEVKPLQYGGSTLANAYLRLRYGSLLDMLKIVPMYLRLLLGSGGVAEHRKLIWNNLLKVFQHAVYFIRHRPGAGAFSFRGWDYEIVRDGVFYEGKGLSEQKPLVSVVTRTYAGREKLLSQCLQSVAHQTYACIEHIIVEDGGDSMAGLIESFSQHYPSSVVRHIPLAKLGRCHAGNSGLAEARGRYVVFLDDDDLFFADHLEVCVAELESDESVSAVYALAWEVETEFEGTSYEERSHATPQVLHQAFDQAVLHRHNYIPIQAIVFDRALFEQHGGFDPELENLEDWNLWIKFASTASFKLVEKTTSMYRTPWSISEKSRRQAILDNYLATAMAKNESYQS